MRVRQPPQQPSLPQFRAARLALLRPAGAPGDGEGGGLSREAIVRAAFDAANRRDADAAVAAFHPDVEFEVLAAVDGPTVHRGCDAVRKLFVTIWSDWAETHSRAERMLERGDCVIVQTTDRRTGREGIVVTGGGAQAWRFEDDLVVRITGYPSWEEALASA